MPTETGGHGTRAKATENSKDEGLIAAASAHFSCLRLPSSAFRLPFAFPEKSGVLSGPAEEHCPVRPDDSLCRTRR